MSTAPSRPQGALLHRLCPLCDIEILEDITICGECGSKLVEVRDEVDTIVGTVIDGRFEMRAKIGQGGMGTVYRAWQKSVGREVAVKLIDRSYSRDAMAVRRFLREARLASQLSQPNTVSVFDFGQVEDGRLFIAMELIRGRTLHEVIQKDGPFSVERTVRIGVQICDALEAAHGLGIVHRDLKLENAIVLDHPPGRDLLKVLDFGLAKNIRDPGSRATDTGIVVGTPRYMSPESSMAGVTSSAGDLYSLGVMLGELATGKPLWKGDSLPELISQKLDPAQVIARMPPALRGVIGKLLEPDPDRRPTAEQTRALLIGVSGTGVSGSAGSGTGLAGTTSATVPFGSLPSTTPAEGTRTLTPSQLEVAKTETPVPAATTSQRGRQRKAALAESSAASTASTSSPSSTGSSSTASSERPSVRRWPLVLVGVGALAAVVVTIVIATGGSDKRADRRAVMPARDAAAVVLAADAGVVEVAVQVDAAAVPAAVDPELVTIHVESQPRGAAVTYLGTTQTAPFDLRVARGKGPIELRAVLAGRQPKKMMVVPDDGKTVVIKLSARATSSDEETPF